MALRIVFREHGRRQVEVELVVALEHGGDLFLETGLRVQPGDLIFVLVCHQLVEVSGDALGEFRCARESQPNVDTGIELAESGQLGRNVNRTNALLRADDVAAEAVREPYVTTALKGTKGPVVAVSDYMRAVPDQISRWVPNDYTSLGTDGFGRSDNREHLRRHFEVDAASIVAAALSKLARDGVIKPKVAEKAFADLGLTTEGSGPAHA